MGPGESSTGLLGATIGYDRPAVPELPDLTIVAEALDAALRERPITRAVAVAPLAVRGTPAELEALVGQRVSGIRRRGKFLLLDLERDAVVVNPMLTGRFQLASDPALKHPTKTAVVVAFGPRAGEATTSAAPWTHGAAWLPTDAARPEIRYRDPTQMGKVYLLPAGIDRPVPGLGSDEIGPDADDAGLTRDIWRERIRRHPGELKNLLRNQAFVAGIGNAYSDEILLRAKLSPLARTDRLKETEIARLHTATQAVLTEWTDRLRAEAGDGFPAKVTAFRPEMAAHGKFGQPCPVCGARIQRIVYAENECNYCPKCQTGGRVLADRSLSRLLHADWPRTPEAWEEEFGMGRLPEAERGA